MSITPRNDQVIEDISSRQKSFYISLGLHKLNEQQDCFLQKEARVCISNAFVLEDSMFK